MDRIAIFIDGGYLDHILKDEFNLPRVDYQKLSEKIAGTLEILRTYYYNCLPYQSPSPTLEENERFGKKQSFYKALEKLPRYEVRPGQLAFRGYNKETEEPILEKKRIDVMLAVDLVVLSFTKQITHVALITGDSDFVPAIKVSKSQGISTILWHGKKSLPHADLWKECDERKIITSKFINSILR